MRRLPQAPVRRADHDEHPSTDGDITAGISDRCGMKGHHVPLGHRHLSKPALTVECGHDTGGTRHLSERSWPVRAR